MSDEWEFFPRRMGEHVAFVFVNLSIGERLAEIGQTSQVLARVRLKQPSDEGLSTDAEFEDLAALEDGFETFCAERGVQLVGRVTVGGHRDFVVYASDVEPVVAGLQTIAGDEHGYHLEVVVREDPEFEVYWKQLYPSPMDWQLISNRRLIEQLEEHGDSGVKSRRVDHWAYFASGEDRDAFASRVEKDGYQIEHCADPDGEADRFSVQFHQEIAPRFPEINAVTVSLSRIAEEFAGEYDGWETAVLAD